MTDVEQPKGLSGSFGVEQSGTDVETFVCGGCGRPFLTKDARKGHQGGTQVRDGKRCAGGEA